MQSFMPICYFVYKIQVIKKGFAGPKRFQGFWEIGPRCSNATTSCKKSWDTLNIWGQFSTFGQLQRLSPLISVVCIADQIENLGKREGVQMSMNSFFCQPGCVFHEKVIFYWQCLNKFATSCSCLVSLTVLFIYKIFIYLFPSFIQSREWLTCYTFTIFWKHSASPSQSHGAS